MAPIKAPRVVASSLRPRTSAATAIPERAKAHADTYRAGKTRRGEHSSAHALVESIRVGNPATFDVRKLAARFREPASQLAQIFATATNRLATAPGHPAVVQAAARLMLGRSATPGELTAASDAFAHGKTVADVTSALAEHLVPIFDLRGTGVTSSTIHNRAESQAVEPGKAGPTSLVDPANQPVDLAQSEGKEKQQLFMDKTLANPLADVIGAYLDTVKNNKYSVNGVTDAANFKLNGQGVDRFLSPGGTLDFRAIAQGKVGDCYFLAGVTAALSTDPSRIQSLIRPATDASGRAGYEISLYKPTSLQVTDTKGNLIDDFSSMRVNDHSVFNGSKQTVFVSQAEIAQWHQDKHLGEADKTSSALELAAVKVAGPSVMNGGDPVSGFYMLTGQNSVTFGDTAQVLAKNPLIGGMTNDQLFVAGEQFLRGGGMITFGLEKTTLNQYGFDPAYNMHDHQFTVVDVTPAGVIVRNPWGGGETGSQVGKAQTQGDGIMTLSWDQVKGGFNTIAISGAGMAENRIPQAMTLPEAQQTVRSGYEDVYQTAWKRDFGSVPVSQGSMSRFVEGQMSKVTGSNIAGQVYQVTVLKDEQVAKLTWKK